MGRLYIKNKVVKEWGDAKKRKAEEDIELNKKQKRIFLFFKLFILLILWGIVCFFHPVWFMIIIVLISIPIIRTKATIVKEVDVV